MGNLPGQVDGNKVFDYFCSPHKLLRMKQLFSVLTLLVAVNVAVAQNANSAASTKGFFGVKAGLNFSNMTGATSVFTNKTKLGPVFGVFYNLPLSSHFSVQPEIDYSGEGTNANGPLGANNTQVLVAVTSYNFINVPVMLQYRTGGFYAEAGPQIGFLVGAKSTLKVGSGSTDLMGQSKGNGFSLGFGAGYYFTKHIGVGARYMAGLTNFDNSGVSGIGSVKSNVISVSALIKF